MIWKEISAFGKDLRRCPRSRNTIKQASALFNIIAIVEGTLACRFLWQMSAVLFMCNRSRFANLKTNAAVCVYVFDIWPANRASCICNVVIPRWKIHSCFLWSIGLGGQKWKTRETGHLSIKGKLSMKHCLMSNTRARAIMDFFLCFNGCQLYADFHSLWVGLVPILLK